MANGKINLGKQSGGVLSISFPDGASNTEVVLPESGELINKDYADLKVALASFIGTNQNLMGNGYQKLPGGLIIQWGSATNTAANTWQSITTPITFPNESLLAVGSSASVNSFGGAGKLNTTGVVAWSNNAGAAINYIAIGY